MEITEIKGISEHRKRLLERLNIYKVLDLVSFFPRYYEDFRSFSSLADSLFGNKEERLVQVKVIGFEKSVTKNNKNILRIKIQDHSATGFLVAFNQPFLQKNLKINDSYIVIGNFSYNFGEIQATNFQIVKPESESLHYGRIVPYYPLTEGLSHRLIRDFTHQALELALPSISENLPEEIIRKRNLISRQKAFFNIHFPENEEIKERAIFRIKYSELFNLEFQMALSKKMFQKTKDRKYEHVNKLKQFLSSMPFQLTNGQKKALSEIKRDLLSSTPMHRLLQGDVGSGKTLVSLISLILVAENGYQGALMVPTEILAQQHYKKIKEMLKETGIEVELLLNATRGKQREEVLTRIKNGRAQIIIGTHALISEGIKYHNLGLAVIDEQHKFGVMQRSALIAKGRNPDILIMTATPIPRTLGITLFGDMDISIIPDKPSGRQTISTFWVGEDKLEEVFSFAESQIQKGFQGYVVYPLIEDSEKVDLKSATTMFETIKKQYLPGRRIALIHGRMDDSEKQKAMDQFLNKEIDVLISTTVIEVGVDVPNATFMIIENAHRFGLSTLHQLRGRVGRSILQSYCYLITPVSLPEEGRQRMKAMRETEDGFILSQKDLEIRGVGEFLGTSQKGFNHLKLANLVKDRDILEKARDDAFQLVDEDPELKKPENKCLEKWRETFLKKHRHQMIRN